MMISLGHWHAYIAFWTGYDQLIMCIPKGDVAMGLPVCFSDDLN